MNSTVDLCFLCLEENENRKNILSQDSDGLVIEEKCRFVLNDHVNIKPEVSYLICLNCMNNLDNAYNFKQMCIQNINKFNNCIDLQRLKDNDLTCNNETVNENFPPIQVVRVKEEFADTCEMQEDYLPKEDIAMHKYDEFSEKEKPEDITAGTNMQYSSTLCEDKLIKKILKKVKKETELQEISEEIHIKDEQLSEATNSDSEDNINDEFQNAGPNTSGESLNLTSYIMSSDSDVEMYTPPDIIEQPKNATSNLLPQKSRERYEIVYKRFMDWRTKNEVKSFSENVLLAYFEDISNTMKPSSLWAIYSMLRATINIKNNANIATYSKLIALLKRKSNGFKSKKSKILTAKQINDFIQNAPDSTYLFLKVVLIIAISGACRKQELRNIQLNDIEDTGKLFIIHIPNSETKSPRSFVVNEAFYPICKKYIQLRPTGRDNLPFFLNYVNEKCTKQCVGINKLGSVPKKIAEFLKLPDAKQYTGHCFRRSSATILADAGGDMLA